MQKVRKVVIPAAGYGTRFLPATKAQPKEMLPVVDTPIIQYVVEEAVASGITDIIIVTSGQKRSIEDHFDYPFELEKFLERAGKKEQLKLVRHIAEMADFIYVRQKGPYGNATPVLSAQHVVGDEPFAVLWGDEFVVAKPPRLKQLLTIFSRYKAPVICLMRVKEKQDVSRYGIAKVKRIRGNVYQILSIVEKPTSADAPSNLAFIGGGVFTPEIFYSLRALKPGKADELWLVDAINLFLKHKPVYGCAVKQGTYYDTGNKLEYLKANIDFALRRKDLQRDLRAYLRTRMRK